MTHYTFIMATGTLTEAGIEREHLAGQPVDIRLASLTTPEEVARETADADGILVTLNPLPSAIIERLGPGVRVIGRAGLGLDTIDLEAARRRGIAVVHTPDYATDEVATHAVAMILATNRRLFAGDDIARTDWRNWRALAPIVSLQMQTAGVVGCGRIGRAVIQRLLPLVGKILVFDPYADRLPTGTTRVETLENLLTQSDIVTLHVPATDETTALLGKREFSLMKPGATLVNVSRGKLVDEIALVEGLAAGRPGAAALDVLAEEPPGSGSPILHAPNVLLSPHFAWYSTSSEQRMRTMAVDGVMDYLEGRPQSVARLAIDPRERTG